jgi:hypothetical protein
MADFGPEPLMSKSPFLFPSILESSHRGKLGSSMPAPGKKKESNEACRCAGDVVPLGYG